MQRVRVFLFLQEVLPILYGYFAAGRRLRFYQETVGETSLIRVEMPEEGRTEKRRRKAAAFLRRAGVRTALNGPADILFLYGIATVKTGDFYRRHAAEAAMQYMTHHGLSPERTTIGIRGQRWTREMAAACEGLAKRVRCLSLALPAWEMENASWELQRRYGLSVPEGDGEVTLCFSTCDPRPGRLLLCGDRPRIKGVFFGGGFPDLPKDAAESLTALLEAQ